MHAESPLGRNDRFRPNPKNPLHNNSTRPGLLPSWTILTPMTLTAGPEEMAAPTTDEATAAIATTYPVPPRNPLSYSGSDLTVSIPVASTTDNTDNTQHSPLPSQSKSRSRSPSDGLPPGCSWGTLPAGASLPPSRKPKSMSTSSSVPSSQSQSQSDIALNPGPGDPVIWVDFPSMSPENPFHFKQSRKVGIVCVAIFFTFITGFATTGWSIGLGSLQRDLHLTDIQGIAGLALYTWGFGAAPLVLAPLSEEFGRKWTCIISIFIYWQAHLFFTLGKNLPTLLVGRFIQGSAGSVGATLVGGTISDIFIPDQRGLPMAFFGVTAIAGTGVGGVATAYVEANPKLEWRWIQWIQYIIVGAYMPIAYLVLRETRASVLLRRKAHQMRRNEPHPKARYTARSEVEKVKFTVAMRQSLSRPLVFLAVEPIVTFFSLWIGLCWGVFYIMIAGLPFVFENIFHFSITGVGLVYLTMLIGPLLGFCFNFANESLYRKHKATRGVEARLFLPMSAGVVFTAGCLIFAFTSVSGVHWMGACVAITIIIASILIIYICVFTYLSECYGSYASSAIAAQSFVRNVFGGAFAFFTHKLFVNLTPRWAIFLFACIAGVLAIVPFIAFYYGPFIRSKSLYSKELMAAEKARIEADEKGECDRGESVELHRQHSLETQRDGEDDALEDALNREPEGQDARGNLEGQEEAKETDPSERLPEKHRRH